MVARLPRHRIRVRRHETWDLDLGVDLWVVPADGSGEPERITDGGGACSLPA